jgi:hypothetical protein
MSFFRNILVLCSSVLHWITLIVREIELCIQFFKCYNVQRSAAAAVCARGRLWNTPKFIRLHRRPAEFIELFSALITGLTASTILVPVDNYIGLVLLWKLHTNIELGWPSLVPAKSMLAIAYF